MARDWRDVLRGVKLADLERHPGRYRKEPYRTALREMQDECARETREAVAAVHDIIDPVSPELHAAFRLFAEDTPWEAAAAISAMKSARMSAIGKGPRNRKLRYTGEFPRWTTAAAKELVRDPEADAPAIAKAIKRETKTKAADRYLRAWAAAANNRSAIEDKAEGMRKVHQMKTTAAHAGWRP